jgi:hypothetical protein
LFPADITTDADASQIPGFSIHQQISLLRNNVHFRASRTVGSQILEESMRPNVGRAILGGFIGTLAMTMMIYWIAPMMGIHMDIAGSLARMMGVSWGMGMAIHFLNGTVIFSLIYAYLLYPLLPGNPIARGALWGVALWFLMESMVMPMLGAGVFNSRMGGMMTVVGVLIAHLLYGGLLGAIAGAPVRREAEVITTGRRAA